MGGEIVIESEVGKGSRFTIRLPLLRGRRKTDAFASATLVPSAPGSPLQPTVEATSA
jgi:hypothetical protein